MTLAAVKVNQSESQLSNKYLCSIFQTMVRLLLGNNFFLFFFLFIYFLLNKYKQNIKISLLDKTFIIFHCSKIRIEKNTGEIGGILVH